MLRCDRRRLDVSMDRISSLPEAIICHILSFLPTKDAVKTTILSPKFLNLWKNITTLRFTYPCFSSTNDKKKMRFVNFVNRVFFVLETKCIDKFSIEFSGFGQRDVIRDSLSNWVAASVARNVKNIEVFVNGSDTYKPWFQLPSCVFACKSLETLQLRNVVVMLNRASLVCLPNLRILRFEDVTIQGDQCIDKIVSGCSSLDTLYLRRRESYDISSFSICSPTIEHLTIISSVRNSSSSVSIFDTSSSDSDISSSDSSSSDSSSSDSDSDSDNDSDTSSSDSEEDEENGVSCGRIKIDAPALKFLHLKQAMLKYVSIKTSSPLIEAVILLGAAKCDQGTFDNLIVALSNVKILVLDFSDIWLEASAPSRLLPMFPNLTGLTLWNFSGQFNFLKELLRKSPTLETLDLHCINSRGNNSFGDLIPGYRSPFLKMVKVVNFYGTKNQLKVLEYILLNASVLKTMKVASPLDSRRKLKLLREISNFRRKSMNCRIKFD